MDELLGEDRAARAFRAKFPEEVLQESLAGQLWFGAECLAAGSSIMNREVESAAMRPLAKAVTKSLDHVRNLLREQCLRNKTPNSLTLNLDLNDAITETLCESLKIFDRLFAEFEFLYVSAMVQVKTKQEHEMQEWICVLFSETLQRALRLGLLEQEQVDYYDPALMFSIPRLAIVAGLVTYTKGPLNMSMPAEHLSEMFRPFRTLLIKIRDLLRTLSANELYQLEKLLCTNEDIHIIQSKEIQIEEKQIIARPADVTSSNYNCDDTDDNDASSSSSNVSSHSSSSTLEVPSSSSCSEPESDRNVINNDVYCTIENDNIPNRNTITANYYDIADGAVSTEMPTLPPQMNVWTNTPITSATTTTIRLMDDLTSTETDTIDDANKDDTQLVTADCASGYLIPNTNFGNLLQTTDTPLTDSFISSDDEYTQIIDNNNITSVDISGDGLVTVVNSSSSHSHLDDASNIAAIINNVTIRSQDMDNTPTMSTIAGLEHDIARSMRVTKSSDSGIGTAENTSLEHTPDSETSNLIMATPSNSVSISVSDNNYLHSTVPDYSPDQRNHMRSEVHSMVIPIVPQMTNSYARNESYTAAVDYERHDEYQRNRLNYETNAQQQQRPSYHHQHHHHNNSNNNHHLHGQHNNRHQRDKCDKKGCTRKHQQAHSANHSTNNGNLNSSKMHHLNSNTAPATHLRRKSARHGSTRHATDEKISISSTSSIYSDGETQEVSLALRSSGRLKFK